MLKQKGEKRIHSLSVNTYQTPTMSQALFPAALGEKFRVAF